MTYNFIKDGLGKGQSWGKKSRWTYGYSFVRQNTLFFKSIIIKKSDYDIVGIIPFIGWLIEPIIVLSTKDGRRLGDRAANTQVVEIKKHYN